MDSTTTPTKTPTLVSLKETLERKSIHWQNAALMAHRRGFCELVSIDDDCITARRSGHGGTCFIFFVEREKVTIKRVGSIIKAVGGRDRPESIIIVYFIAITPDAKTALASNGAFKFETFTAESMSFDPISIIDNPYVLYDGPPIKEKSALPKIGDCITRYYNFPIGSVIYVVDPFTEIPCLYTVIRPIEE